MHRDAYTGVIILIVDFIIINNYIFGGINFRREEAKRNI